MYTHNDMERHAPVMRDLFAATLDRGLELWVDNWSLGGAPGESSHFLSYAPEARQIFNDGEPWKKMVCLNFPAFVRFTKEWIDCVYNADTAAFGSGASVAAKATAIAVPTRSRPGRRLARP